MTDTGRLCGISATNLEPRDAPRQLLFDEADRQKGERLGDTIDKVAAASLQVVGDVAVALVR